MPSLSSVWFSVGWTLEYLLCQVLKILCRLAMMAKRSQSWCVVAGEENGTKNYFYAIEFDAKPLQLQSMDHPLPTPSSKPKEEWERRSVLEILLFCCASSLGSICPSPQPAPVEIILPEWYHPKVSWQKAKTTGKCQWATHVEGGAKSCAQTVRYVSRTENRRSPLAFTSNNYLMCSNRY